ncbi:helix-turn-helix domain-containing protein [Tissierella creatinophila]|uniref:Helix-turn-helix domain protein n=1 Tax=Tissierella creatinophila DSM 6911 TaxID=1123403 RepID=A0A1U7M6Q1_TISCR|nr:helix-turn-helix domain-containing protein [Tissierella creatinophila]OLS02955.1 helix-turn-helix domain protein [Tissierella creatinophila DSM 6911]
MLKAYKYRIYPTNEQRLYLAKNFGGVLSFKYSLGYNNKEISDILKITKVDVRKRISRGKEKIEKMLSEDGGFESLDRLINSKKHTTFCIHLGGVI